jgi:hypothetical protein
MLGDLWLTPITVMSKRLYEILVHSGVDNLDTYEVELHDPEDGTVYKDFIAFNIVGKITAAESMKTRFAPNNKERLISADIDSLSIDESKAAGLLMFRLAESVNTIILHESVKKIIEAAGINTLTFIEPEEWAS